jgi:aminoglycoside phosphotransferase (APT) family kinase protein
MTTDDRVTAILTHLFAEATAVTSEMAAGSTLGYTYFVTVGSSTDRTHYVLKLAKTDAAQKLRYYRTDHTGQAATDAMMVEAALLNRLAHQTAVPVPQVIQVDESPDDALQPYLLLEQIPGTPLNDVSDLSAETWRQYLADMGHRFALLGNTVQFDSFGSLGCRHGTVETMDSQPTWPSWIETQYTTYLKRLKSTSLADLSSKLDAWYRQRRDRLPVQPDPVLVHDDVHLANILVNTTAADARLTALLDWEEVLAAPREFQVARLEYSLFVAGDLTSTAGPRAREWLQHRYWDHSHRQRRQAYDEYRLVYYLLIWLRMAGNLQFDDDVGMEMRTTVEQALRDELETILAFS